MIRKKWLTAALLLSSTSAWGVSSGPDLDISVDPTIYRFGDVAVGASSAPVTFTVSNSGATDLTLGTLSLTGPHASQFVLGTNSCDGQLVVVGGSCTLSVTHTRTERGYKHAALTIPSNDTETPILEAYLSTKEDLASEAARRLPPVLYAVNIPEVMTAGTTYTLTWTLLGYDDSYKSTLVFFNCAIDPVNCGASYGDASRFETSSPLVPVSTAVGAWSYSGRPATEYHYSYDFTPSVSTFNSQTSIVLRFYSKNADDDASGQGSLSLMIPGNLAADYADSSGRRIRKTINP